MRNKVFLGVFLALVALTIWGVAEPADWRWKCSSADGTAGSFDLPPTRVSATPSGWVLDTQNVGVKTFDSCEGSQP